MLSTTRYASFYPMILLTFVLAWPVQQAVPVLTGRVVDRAEILSPATEEAITALLAAHEEATSNQVAVLTISSLEGETIEGFSIRVAETWALGTAENDNGVLLLVALNDREMRIEVGLGLEGVLTDALTSQIIRNEMTPRFREGDFDAGVLVGVQGIVGTIEGTYLPPEVSAGEPPPFWVGLLFLLIPSIFAVIGVFLPGWLRWMLFFFLIPFFWASGLMITGREGGGTVVVVLSAIVFIAAQFHPKIRAVQKSHKERFATATAGGSSSSRWSSGSSGSSGSSWSSSSSFSGGGGSFGGGGSSGSW